jgi:hypothetical protein
MSGRVFACYGMFRTRMLCLIRLNSQGASRQFFVVSDRVVTMPATTGAHCVGSHLRIVPGRDSRAKDRNTPHDRR